VGSNDRRGEVRLWQLHTGRPASNSVTLDFHDPEAIIGTIAISPDGTRLAAAGHDLRIWDLTNLAAPPIVLGVLGGPGIPPVVTLEKTAEALRVAAVHPREVHTVAVLRRYNPLLDYKDSSKILGLL
jgi:WD40 repeat protein